MRKYLVAASMAALALGATTTAASSAQTGGFYIGDTIMVGYQFCPRGFGEAAGGLLSISSNTALFSLIGCTYGGDCRTTMALPDLRGRMPIQQGNAPGIGNYQWGQRGGAENVTLSQANLASHRHVLKATNAGNNAVSPQGHSFTTLTGPNEIAYNTGVNVTFENDVIASNGSNQPVNIMSSSLVVRYCVAMTGIFPSRN